MAENNCFLYVALSNWTPKMKLREWHATLVDQKKLTTNPLDAKWAPGSDLSMFVMFISFLCAVEVQAPGDILLGAVLWTFLQPFVAFKPFLLC